MPRSDKEIRKVFPSDIRWISTTRDSQAPLSALDHGGNNGAPSSLQKTGGSCTSAFLQAAYSQSKSYPSWSSTIEYMNQLLDGAGLDQEAQLQSSRQLDINAPVDIVPRDFNGKRRAVLIGINYCGQKRSELPSCHDSVFGMKKFLVEREGFADDDITLLMDLKGHPYYPTRKNILTCFRRLVKQSNFRDVVFVHFAGHNGRMMDTTKKKGSQNFIETLIPVDYEKSGPILANEIYQELLCAMPSDVKMTCVMDCCHGGSVIRLPYVYTSNKAADSQMYYDESFDFGALIGLAIIGGVLVTVAGTTSGDGGGNVTTADGAGGGGGDDGNVGASSGSEDDCCGGCCEGLFEGLFD